MNMAQLFKRTKKSCLKFFRKLTSSTKLASQLEDESVGSRPMHQCMNQDDRIRNRDIPIRCPYTISSKIPRNPNKTKINSQNSNNKSSQSETKRSKNFIVSSTYTNKLDTYFTNARRTMRPTFLSCDTRRVRNFQPLSEEDTFNMAAEFSLRRYSTEIIFEKVRYRDNIRYFRRTPSNSSLSSHPSTPKMVQASKEYNYVLNGRNTNSMYCSNRQSNIYLQFRNNISHPVNFTLTSNTPGNLNNLVISEGRNWLNEPCPIVTWDINGNSIDDDAIYLNNNWDDFDNKLNMLRDKRLTKTRSEGSYKSSSKSSSTTLETWVDDEVLDNSFNEEIEKQFRM